jgi:hypothetical protein
VRVKRNKGKLAKKVTYRGKSGVELKEKEKHNKRLSKTSKELKCYRDSKVGEFKKVR